MTFFAGDELAAADLNAILAALPSVTVKTASTDRISTITMASDPELTGIPLSVGTWSIVFEGLWTQASAAAKMATQWAFTGTTAATARRKCMGAGSAQVAAPSLITESTFAGYDTSTSALYDVSTSTQYSVIRESVDNFVVTVAGLFSIQWAQGVSTASNVTMRPGSSVTVRKIS